MPKEYSKYVRWGLVLAGLSLWLINWWAGRPLFIDEANVARNIFDRSFGEFFLPLDHRQYAPPLYLVLTKACALLFGYGEMALRLPAMLGGGMAVAGLWLAGRELKLGWWALLPLALLFLNPTVLRYVGELKPYSLDLGLAAIVLAMALRDLKPSWSWLAVGVVSPWLSLPSVFVLAAVGITGFFTLLSDKHRTRDRARKSIGRWLLCGATWIASFSILYLTILRHSIGSRYLDTYHQRFYFPMPGNGFDPGRAVELLLELPYVTFGFTTIAIIFGLLMMFFGLLRQFSDRKMMLLLPAIIAYIASAFGQYSLLPRLILFAIPGCWLLAAIGSRDMFQRLDPAKYWRYGLPVLWLVVLGSTNVFRHFYQPLTFSDSRQLVTEVAEGYQPVLHHSVLPSWDYYHRIHPVTRQEGSVPMSANDIREMNFPGRYVLLYDVLTQGNIRESVRADRMWATERGCKVRTAAMFRAAAVYVDCE